MYRIPASLSLLLLVPISCLPAFAAKPVQHVVISFDGAQDIAQWERSRALARSTGAQFTYFLSCVYLMTSENRQTYSPPRHRQGGSNVGVAESREDVGRRLRQIWTARLEGHEIASHGCGHFDGGNWSAGEWVQEFSAFRHILTEAWTLNAIPFEPAAWRRFAQEEIVGFRAPYLSTGKGLFDALEDTGHDYDASTVSRGPVDTADGTLLRFSLPMIAEGPQSRPVIAMDYNLFVRHSGGFDQADRTVEFENRALAAFNNAFEAEYSGDRRPLQIGFHFTLMNGAAYWRALERFAEDVCGREDVACVSYRSLVRIIRERDRTGSVTPD